MVVWKENDGLKTYDKPTVIEMGTSSLKRCENARMKLRPTEKFSNLHNLHF